MICQEHPDIELREEYTKEEGYTAFCPLCPKRYVLCYNILYMTPCALEKGHEGLHKDKEGHQWNDNAREFIYIKK